MEEHRLALVPGYQFEQFRIEATLGKGGFGITYRALDLHLNKRVALKELLPDSIATRIDGSTVVPHSASLEESWQWARERFLEEAKILAGFSHPAIVGVHRLIEANGTVYMVMDYVEGETYEAQLRRTGPVRNQAALLAVLSPLLSGLAEVHRKGLIHRDIKPDNILINRHGNPILIDFGSARSAIGATMTMTSIVTHGYSPFEQYQTQGRMGPWTDIYALGAVACRAITGEKPQVAADRIEEEKFVWVSHRGLTGFSEECLAAIDWALRVRVNERPQRIEDWERHLMTGMQGNVQIPQPMPSKAKIAQPKIAYPIHSKPNKRKSKGILIGVVIAIALLGAIFGGAMILEAKEKSAIHAAAEQGHTAAQFTLGEMYEKGLGVAKDEAEAVRWYRQAAEQGHAEAQNSLGEMYGHGKGVAKDNAEAMKWYRKAADQGNASAQNNIGWIFRYNKDQAGAMKWYRKAADQGNSVAQSILGEMYEKGLGVAKDEAEAVRWYRKAAEQGFASNQYTLGRMYEHGKGVAKDNAEAMKWYRKAADQGKQGNAQAQYSLGWMYAHGSGVAKDEAEAVRWYRKAAAKRNADAIEELKQRGL